ncbi:MAG: hypothetical protein HFE94_05380 [Acutalibacter sp.]|nr:hypothetical protein [Acutalibacter sp.]
MEAYELTLKTNRFLIQDGTLTEKQKDHILCQLLAARSTPEEAERFYRGVRCPGNRDREGRRMYPECFIPPYNQGKKVKTLMNQTPKTQLFSSNLYELEILRLLCVLGPGLPEAEELKNRTLERLKTTCFGFQDDGVGECFDTALVVLRFLAAAAPEEEAWIQGRLDNFNRHYGEKKRPWFCLWYYWLCLSELPFERVRPQVDAYKDVMLNWLENKSMVMHSEHDATVHPMLMHMLRDNVCRYPEYAYIKDRRPYVREKDGRLYFDMRC